DSTAWRRFRARTCSGVARSARSLVPVSPTYSATCCATISRAPSRDSAPSCTGAPARGTAPRARSTGQSSWRITAWISARTLAVLQVAGVLRRGVEGHERLLPPGTAVGLYREPKTDAVDANWQLVRYVFRVRDGLDINVRLVHVGAAAPCFCACGGPL